MNSIRILFNLGEWVRGVRVIVGRLAPILCISISLSGCIAAAVPLMMGASVGVAALSGFEMYKVVQLQGGGSVRIEFPGKDGKTSPPTPITSVRRVAVWPGDEGDVRFAERLQTSGRFSNVVSPAAVATILADAKTPSNLKQLTQQEQNVAFDLVCRRANVEFVFGSRALGQSENDNAFSFSQANITFKADLLGYSCTQRAVVWRDQIALVINVGGSVASMDEMNQASADAWADRVMAAMDQSVSGPKA